jgi:ABC-2 type transport system ATP-binding protein
VTVFLNSHLLTEVEQVCDRVAIVDRGRIVAIGPLSEVTADGFAVRVRVDGAAQPAVVVLNAFGTAVEEDGAVVVSGIDPERVSEAVAELVRAGVRIRAVEPNRRSLEEQFVRILRGSADAAARDR